MDVLKFVMTYEFQATHKPHIWVNITELDFDCVTPPNKCANFVEMKHKREKNASGRLLESYCVII